ncbi:hypothetical protein [Prescottella agglutinans]|uniref:Uncharacterized protein n=1 Tax=Prescottella agglutinans TaxID=1644129 RepID=A0ABT6M761_9NOCA|nr:hypothetical protein [Prescottella agglutinans]MDH6280136.1 hypothetical protein [Prescottella agglutinans]
MTHRSLTHVQVDVDRDHARDVLSTTKTRTRYGTVRVAALSSGSATAATLALGGSALLVATAAVLILISVMVADLLI